jgi:tetratricopeptide (TPR) repeat protein
MEAVGDVAALFLELWRTRATGILEVVGDEGVRTDLFLRDGEVIFAEQGTLGETLGRLLLREGVLTQEQYAAVIDRMTQKLVDTEQLRFGEAAVQLGFVDPQQIHEGLALQVQLKAARCLASTRVECTLREDPDALTAVTPFPTQLLDCVLRGMREHYDDLRVNHLLFEVADHAPSMTDGGRTLLAKLRFLPAENRLIDGLRGTHTVLQIVRQAKDPLAAKRVLAFLHLAETLAMEPPSERAVPTSEGEPAPTAEELDSPAADELPAKRAPAPTAPKDGSKPKIGRRSALAMRIARAVGRSIPPPVSEKRARLEAEQEFAKGRQLAERARWEEAHKAFRRATRCMPEALEYALHSIWAEVMTSSTAEERIARLKSAGGIARRALRQEPNLAYAHFVQANVDLELGNAQSALRRFRRAASLDPELTEAVRHARLLQRRLER